MATQLQIRRGTTSQMNAFTGAEGELAVNTTTDTVHVHDGSTAGGFALAKADGSNIATYAGSFTTLTVDTNTLVVDATNNRVGIGTSSPLTLSGNAAPGLTVSSNGPFILLQDANNADKVRYISNNTGDLQFGIVGDDGATGKTEHMRIDGATGNVGIGVTAPSALLNIAHESHGIALGYEGATLPVTAGMYTSSSTNFGQAYGSLVIQSRTDYAGYSTIFRGNGGETMRLSGGNLLVGSSVATGARLSVIDSSVASKQIVFSNNATYYGSVGHNAGTGYNEYRTEAGGIHAFFRGTSTTADALIDSSGRLLVNTASILQGTSAKLQVLQTIGDQWSTRINNSTSSPYGLAISYVSASPNGTANQFHYCTDSGGARWGVYSNGGVLNYSGNNVNLSDRNAKKDITLHTDDEWNCVKAWEIVDYRYNDEADDSPAKIGVIAQQIQEHCPDLVNVFQEQADAVEEVLGEDGEVVTEAKAAVEERIGVNEAQMMWKVTKALQEAMERIETLEAKVQALENNQ